MSNARNLANLLGTNTKVKDVDVDGTELILDADGDSSITSDTDDQIDFKTGGSDRVTIDSSGNVGIGTSSPSRTFHVTRSDGTGTVVKVGNTGSTTSSIEFANTGSTDTISIGAENNDLVLKSDDGDISLNATGDPATASLIVERGGNVGIGTSSPDTKLHIDGTNTVLLITEDSEGDATLRLGDTQGNLSQSMAISFDTGGGSTKFTSNGTTERMRIDSSGNVLVGGTNNDDGNDGIKLRASGELVVEQDNSLPVKINRKTSDGELIRLQKDGSDIGKIGASGGGSYIGDGDTGLKFEGGTDDIRPFSTSGVATRDNAIDLGDGSARFDDIFATNTSITTSDQNEKQDIASLTTKELNVAKKLSILFKTFRWKDKVVEKGDKARTHTGIIAQEVQSAFSAEGLDCSKYGLFTSDTWWEKDKEVYDTKEEAPKDATEKTRLGVRYPELFSFIFSSIEARLTALESK